MQWPTARGSLVAILIFLACTAIWSCGGSEPAPAKGGAVGGMTLVIRWPSGASREIPSNSRSIKLLVQEFVETADGIAPEVGATLAEKSVSRPDGELTSTVRFTELPPIRVLVTATAHESVDASGPVLATGTATPIVVAGEAVSTSIELKPSVEVPTLNVVSIKYAVRIGSRNLEPFYGPSPKAQDFLGCHAEASGNTARIIPANGTPTGAGMQFIVVLTNVREDIIEVSLPLRITGAVYEFGNFNDDSEYTINDGNIRIRSFSNHKPPLDPLTSVDETVQLRLRRQFGFQADVEIEVRSLDSREQFLSFELGEIPAGIGRVSVHEAQAGNQRPALASRLGGVE